MQDVKLPPAEVIHIPTLYGGAYGVDLEDVANHNGLTPEQVINIHSGTDYLVYMLGFTPGFSYLGGMSEKIATPRLESPREEISAGSVGIAGKQTGIYPISSPGGWRLIGRTPVQLFNPDRNPAVLLKAGQYVRFEAIDEKEYKAICEQIEKGAYSVRKSALRRDETNE
jgi:KipI family sensor histidine kinase inhibitor